MGSEQAALDATESRIQPPRGAGRRTNGWQTRTHGWPTRTDGAFVRFELTLAPSTPSVGRARAAVVRWLPDDVAAEALADAKLVVSELVANSVRHGALASDGFVCVRLALGAGLMHVEVEDSGTTGVVAPRAPDLDGGGGFGLQIVAALARRWGIVREPGTRVWVELASAPAET
jgi:anti-sigma regulatory factor (Ser/Thr protein kinase)